MNKYNILQKGTQGVVLLLYGWFTWLMINITLQYLPVNLDVAFLRIKQDYIQLIHYQIAFFIHVFSALLVLLAGFTQFSRKIRTNYFWLHQWSGWLYAGITILLAAPSGFIIGLYANGGWLSQLAFCLLAVFWWFFTIIAIWKAKLGDINAHQRWMLRSFALAMSAITLRAWKYVLVSLFHPRPMDVYRWVAWLSWVVNLVIIEIIIYKKLR